MKQTIELSCGETGVRLDAWLVKNLEGFSRSGIQKMIAEGHVFANGAAVAKNYKIRNGDRIQIVAPAARDALSQPAVAPPQDAYAPPKDAYAQDIKLNIVYEDDHIIVVDKPRGMVVHPGNGNRDGTLANALAFHCSGGLSDIGGAIRPGIVHRLDKDTSGLVVAAKNNEAHYKLAADFKERKVRKIYDAIVRGHVRQNPGRIEMPIGRHQTDRKRMTVSENGGKFAVTLFKVVTTLPCAHTWLELELITGRTHQIRVHLAKIGHPVACDPVYGGRVKKTVCPGRGKCGLEFHNAAPDACPLQSASQGQLLHATRLEFNHPITNERLCFTSELPGYFPKRVNKRED